MTEYSLPLTEIDIVDGFHAYRDKASNAGDFRGLVEVSWSGDLLIVQMLSLALPDGRMLDGRLLGTRRIHGITHAIFFFTQYPDQIWSSACLREEGERATVERVSMTVMAHAVDEPLYGESPYVTPRFIFLRQGESFDNMPD